MKGRLKITYDPPTPHRGTVGGVRVNARYLDDELFMTQPCLWCGKNNFQDLVPMVLRLCRTCRAIRAM